MLVKVRRIGPQVAIALALLLTAGCHGDANRESPPLPAPSLADVEVGDDVRIRIEEVDRGDRTSTVRVTRNRRGSPTADTLLLVCGMAKVAQARGAAYFTNLKEWPEPDGTRMYVLGFSGSDAVDLQAYFGAQYSRENEYGQARALLATADWKDWWER
jgi:hypothetical protein